MKKRIHNPDLDESSILSDARKILAPQIEDRSRRSFLLHGLTLGGVASSHKFIEQSGTNL